MIKQKQKITRCIGEDLTNYFKYNFAIHHHNATVFDIFLRYRKMSHTNGEKVFVCLMRK